MRVITVVSFSTRKDRNHFDQLFCQHLSEARTSKKNVLTKSFVKELRELYMINNNNR